MADPYPIAEDDPQAPVARDVEETLAQGLGRELTEAGFTVTSAVRVHPYFDARVDLILARDGGPTIVGEIKSLPESVRVTTDSVQQVQHMAQLYQRERGVPTVGLLVTTGELTVLAQRYADECTPRVYVTDPQGAAKVAMGIR